MAFVLRVLDGLKELGHRITYKIFRTFRIDGFFIQ